METAQPTPRSVAARRRSRALRLISTTLIVAGAALLVWVLVVWRWNDPFTSLYTRWQQHRLADEYAVVEAREPRRPVPAGATPHDAAAAMKTAARRFRTSAATGSPIGRLVVPRLGVDMITVNGTDTATLRKGPGRDERTFMPGEGELVYIAGHRTTYLAPFARIDRLRPGDRVTLRMPYGTFEYKVSGHRIVDAGDLSVLRSKHREVVALQACHPRFFATQRYIVWARPTRVVPRGAAPYVPRDG